MKTKKSSNAEEWQAKRVENRLNFIRESIKLTKGVRFESYNAFAVYLAARLSEHEMMQAKHLYEISQADEPFKPPRPVSRQIFFTNQAYRTVAEAAYTGRKIQGSGSIEQPRTVSEFNAVLLQKEFEISNLETELARSKSDIEAIKGKLILEDTPNDNVKEILREKSLVVQAIIHLLRWGDGIIEFSDGRIIDKGRRGSRAVIVDKQYLLPCASTIDNALNGFVLDD